MKFLVKLFILILFASCVQEIPLEELENETFVDPGTDSSSVANPVPVEDKIAPKILATSPMATLPASTRTAVLQVQTDESAECRFDLSLKNFDLMINNLPSSNNGTIHTRNFNVSEDTSYFFYVLCRDSNKNVSLTNQITFKVDKAGVVDSVAPMLSSLLPSGKLVAGTTQTMLQLSTNESATCRYSMSSVVDYDGMLSFQTSNNFSHFAMISGLQNGGSYNYYVLCKDVAGNQSNKQIISFAVDNLELNGQVLYANNCMSCHSGLDTSTKKNKTAQQIQDAINNVSQMNLDYLKALVPSQVSSIAEVLKVAAPVDKTAPIISMAQPSGVQPSTSTNLTLQVQTNEQASCRYSQNNQSYDQMSQTLSTVSTGKIHSRSVSVQADMNYIYYVRCSDAYGNKNSSSTLISFFVDKVPDTIAPIISNVAPSGKIPAGTKSVQLSLSTNENANCRYSLNNSAGYSQMMVMGQTGSLSHSHSITGLADGMSYSYYVLCRDGANNTSIKSTTSFTVEMPVVISLDERARGILNSRCLNCHGGSFTYKQLDVSDNESLFDPLNKFIVKGTPNESKVYLSLSGDNNISMMPPSGAIPNSEKETIRQWIAEMQPDNNEEEIVCDVSEDNKSPLTRRLTKVEIKNSFEELLGKAYIPDLSSLPKSGESQFGMTRNGDTQGGYSPQAIEVLLGLFEGVVSSAVDGNVVAASCANLSGSNLNNCLNTNLIPLIERAWRRVLSTTERQVIHSYFSNQTFKRGLNIALLKTFLSPRFLFISYDDNISPRKLNNFEIAERLAFLVTARVPSQALMNAAKTIDLSNKTNLISEMNKLFDSTNISNASNLQRSKGWWFYRELQNQWLGLSHLDENSSAGSNAQSMKWANMFYLEEMFKKNRSINQMLTDNFVVMDRNLASIYGADFNSAVPANYDIYNSPNGYRKLVVGDNSRKGLLTQAAILTVNGKTNADGEVNPTHRGMWHASKILCDTPEGFPADIQIDNSSVGTGSLKQMFAAHVDQGTTCYGCHKIMDPIGFGLWGYDGVGKQREKDTWGYPVDPSGELEGQFFQETDQMIDIIAQSKKTEQCVMSHLASYIVARDVDSKKSCETQEILKEVKNKNGGLRDILQEIVTSDLFVMRK